MNITIDYLKHYPQHVSCVAKWMFDTWGHFHPGDDISITEAYVQKHLNNDSLPITYIALIDDKPVGTASLCETDGIRPGVMPWLASLFVHPKYRQQGIGEQLIHHITKKATIMGFPNCYLLAFDETIPEYYKRLDWQFIGMDQLYNSPVSVMKLNLIKE